MNILVGDRKSELSFDMQPAFPKFVSQHRLIRRLQQARSQITMNLDRRVNNLTSKFIDFQCNQPLEMNCRDTELHRETHSSRAKNSVLLRVSVVILLLGLLSHSGPIVSLANAADNTNPGTKVDAPARPTRLMGFIMRQNNGFVENADTPFFAYLAHTLPHGPFFLSFTN